MTCGICENTHASYRHRKTKTKNIISPSGKLNGKKDVLKHKHKHTHANIYTHTQPELSWREWDASWKIGYSTHSSNIQTVRDFRMKQQSHSSAEYSFWRKCMWMRVQVQELQILRSMVGVKPSPWHRTYDSLKTHYAHVTKNKYLLTGAIVNSLLHWDFPSKNKQNE